MAEELHPCQHEGLPGTLAADADAATEALLERVVQEIPLYRTLDPVQLADVRETVRAGYLAALGLWEVGGWLDAEQLARFRVNGATRAAEGRPLPLVLRAYRVTGLAIYDHVMGHPAVRLDAAEERNFARLVMAFVDQLSNEVTLGYVETTGQLASQQGRARREFLDDLLSGRLLGGAEVAERAATLGLVLPRTPSLIVAVPRVGEGSTLVDRARVALAELVRVDQGSEAPLRLQLLTRGQWVLIDEQRDPASVHRALGVAGLSGIALAVPDLTDLAATYQQARQVLELQLTAMVPADLIIDEDDALALSFLARAREGGRSAPMVGAILRDLLSPANTVLRETLDAYLVAGNAVSAAHQLGVHAQTMRYRLKRIQEITGRDPARGWDRFVLELALRLSDRPAVTA